MGCRATLIIIIVPRCQRWIHNSSWKQIVLLLQMCDGTSECVWLYAYCYLINKLFHQYWSESLWYHTTVKKSTVFQISKPFKQTIMLLQAKLVLLIVFQLFIIHSTTSNQARYSRNANNDRLPISFGAAKMFQPLPATIVGAHCQWEVKFNTVFNRIPQTFTEIMCQQPSNTCGGNHAYTCRQIRSKMLVGYTEGGNIVSLRNNTVNIGCSCVRRSSSPVQQFLQPIQQKRSTRTSSSIQRRSTDGMDEPALNDFLEQDSLNEDFSNILM